MKPWIVRAILLGALAALGYWLWTVFFPNPEKVIRDRIHEIAKLASFASNEGALAKLSNAQKLSSYVAENVEIHIEFHRRSEQVYAGRNEILQACVAARNMASGLTIEFPDVVLTVHPGKQSATAEVTLRAQMHGERDYIVQELKIEFIKSDGEWLIRRAETVRTLQ
jgi:hypothetical protein